MIILYGKITALEPLHIGYGKRIGNYYPTLSYIPAQTLRGMLGNYLYFNDKAAFKSLKIDDDCNPLLYFKPAVPTGCVATPLCVKWCKNCNKMFNLNEIKSKECSECYHEGTKKSGWMKREGLEEKKWLGAEYGQKTTISTKCPIVPERDTTYAGDEPKAPFNVGAIRKGAVFDFRLVLPSEHVDKIKTALVEAGIFYGVGGFRSKGYGTVLFENFKEEDVEEYIKKRSNEIKSTTAMVLNSPAIFFKDDIQTKIIQKTEIGFDYWAKKHSIQIREQFIDETLARSWKIKPVDRYGKRRGYHLDEIYPALKEGSTVIIEIDPKLAGTLEVYGIGDFNHIHGDVYFTNEVIL